MKYTRVPTNTMQAIQPNAGIVVDSFTPATGAIGNILGATGGGVEFDPHPNFIDRGDGIDNMPKNTWQMKDIDYFEPHLTGTFKTMEATLAKLMQGGATLDGKHIVPGNKLTQAHFHDCWLICDYGDKNIESEAGDTAGFIAIHLKNAMNVLGFRLKTNDKGKGDFQFDFQAHYDIENIDDVPFEFYVQEGTAAASGTGTDDPTP